MNRDLRHLLNEAGVAGALEADVWRRVVVLNNYGAIPEPAGYSVEFARRGFQLLVLDSSARPTHYVRCRSANDDAFRREGDILGALGADSLACAFVPRAQTVASATMRVQVTEFIPGVTYQHVVGRQRPRTWYRAVTNILDLVDVVCRRAEVLLPGVASSPDVDLVREARPSLDRLRQDPDVGELVPVLERAMAEVGTLDRRVQHGDMWPNNVLFNRGSWHLIDFEEFARVAVPMYDVFHMIQSCARMRGGRRTGEWLPLGVGARGRWAGANRAVVDVERRRSGLTRTEAGAALVFYVVRMAAHRLRPGVPREFAAGLLSDLRFVGGVLADGLPLEHLIVP